MPDKVGYWREDKIETTINGRKCYNQTVISCSHCHIIMPNRSNYCPVCGYRLYSALEYIDLRSKGEI